MRYKRQKTKVSKYISQNSGEKGCRKSTLKKQISAALLLVTVMFSLSGIGIVKRPVIKSIFGYSSYLPKKFSVSAFKNSPVVKKFGEQILDFCSGYLKGKDVSKPRAYAVVKDNTADTGTEALQETAAESDSFMALSDALPKETFEPLWPCVGELSSEFGERIHPVSGEIKTHNGIDIAADEGDKIFACEDGVVTVAEFNDYSGNYVIISHAGGYTSSYSHMSELGASEGMAVKKGDVIGLVGSTGIATGPHLHFEIKQGDTPVDPQMLIVSG